MNDDVDYILKEGKMTPQVEIFLRATGMSLKEAVKQKYISINRKKKLIVTPKGNNAKQRRRSI